MTGCQGTEALAFDGRNDLELAAAGRADLQQSNAHRPCAGAFERRALQGQRAQPLHSVEASAASSSLKWLATKREQLARLPNRSRCASAMRDHRSTVSVPSRPCTSPPGIVHLPGSDTEVRSPIDSWIREPTTGTTNDDRSLTQLNLLLPMALLVFSDPTP